MLKSIFIAAAAAASIATAFVALTMEHRGKGADAMRPAAHEFGFGPRASARQLYAATLQPRQPLRVRQLHTLPVLITGERAPDGRRPHLGGRWHA